MTSFVLRNARLVLDAEVVHGSLQVVDGRIAAIDSGATAVAGAIDLDGDLLIPGLVEVHTDNLERHMMPRPKVFWSEMPALLAHDSEVAGAGITTVLDALGVGEADPDSLRGSTWDTMLRCLDECSAHGALRAEHLLHVRCELPAPNTIELFQAFQGHPLLRLISLMDHTPGQRQWENLEQARIYYIGKKGWSEAKFRQRVAEGEGLQVRYVQPHRAWFVDYCRRHGLGMASHDDTTAAHVEQAHADGATISEFPTTEVAARHAHARGMRTVMGGPNVVRGGSHSGNVAASELARAGLLDILSSDYVPASLLGAAFVLHQQHGLTLPEVLAMVARQPAAALGLHDRGRLAPGLRADLVQVRPLAAFDGATRPVVRAVWRQGRRVA
jgi:alpha-D-ribose 1-methylphosphonate 5-triphosphate diphosphatase